MKTYNPANWYWAVAGDAARVYSSAVGDYVLVADPAYVLWRQDDTRPTPIASVDELGRS
jgi:hypothetical protein